MAYIHIFTSKKSTTRHTFYKIFFCRNPIKTSFMIHIKDNTFQNKSSVCLEASLSLEPGIVHTCDQECGAIHSTVFLVVGCCAMGKTISGDGHQWWAQVPGLGSLGRAWSMGDHWRLHLLRLLSKAQSHRATGFSKSMAARGSSCIDLRLTWQP